MNPALPLPLLEPTLPRAEIESRLAQTQRWETLGVLASGVARDFNQLLDAIAGHADSVERLLPDEHPARHEIALIRTAVQRATGLAHHVHRFSQRDAEADAVNLAALIHDALPLLRASLPDTIEVRAGLDLDPAFVSAPSSELLQVFFNLGTNAGQAIAHAGTVTVTLSRLAADERPRIEVGTLGPEPHLCLSVSDTGDGIAPEVLNHIFEPFFTTKARPLGTGLGLAIVRAIVLQHRGGIAVDSRPGAGTTFRVYLPELHLSDEAGPPPVASVAADPSTLHIAIIDDEDVVLQLTDQALTLSGYRTTLTSPEACLAELMRNASAYDLIVTDQRMPTMTGSELLQALRAGGSSIPVLVTSGSFTTEITREIHSAGGASFLPKPFTLDGLLNAVHELIGSTRAV